MSTDDCTTIDSPCLCGRGVISVEQCTPDHPWARESQTSYSAALKCDECAKKYTIIQRDSNNLPTLVLREEVEAQAAVRAAYAAAEKVIMSNPSVQAIKPKIVEMIDSQPNKKARHRLLEKMSLARATYQTYLRNPYGGKEALEYTSGSHIADIGFSFGLFSDADALALKISLEELKKIGAQEKYPKPVKTGARWMSH